VTPPILRPAKNEDHSFYVLSTLTRATHAGEYTGLKPVKGRRFSAFPEKPVSPYSRLVNVDVFRPSHAVVAPKTPLGSQDNKVRLVFLPMHEVLLVELFTHSVWVETDLVTHTREREEVIIFIFSKNPHTGLAGFQKAVTGFLNYIITSGVEGVDGVFKHNKHKTVETRTSLGEWARGRGDIVNVTIVVRSFVVR
jgi:hypothetical protein